MFFKNISWGKGQNIKIKLVRWGLLSAGIILSIICFWWGIKLTNNKNLAVVITGLLGMIIGFSYRPLYEKINAWLAYYDDIYFEKSRRFNLGSSGEEMVKREVEKIFGNKDYFLRSNFVAPGEKFDIDEIIICEKGLIILEIKNYECDYFFKGEEFSTKIGKRTIEQPRYWDPRNEASWHANYLDQYLKQNGFADIKINKAVMLVREQSASFEGKPFVYIIIGLSKLKQYFDDLPVDQSFDTERMLKLKTLLNK